jgi:hypothetical protein
LPAHCCQPAVVAGGVIYADLRGELSTHLVPRLCLLRILLGQPPLLQAFPFPSTLGEVTLHPLSQACLFTVHMGSGSPPPPLEFSFHRHFYKLSSSWLLGMCHHSCLLQPACCKGFPLPDSLVLNSLLHVFFVVIAFYSVFFSFFPWVGGWSVQGAMLIWSRIVCGSTTCRLAHPCGLHLPKLSGCCRLAATWEPCWFLHLT